MKFKSLVIIVILILKQYSASADENYAISYEFIDLQNNQIVSENNTNKYVMVASVQKILTSFAALKILSLEYQFETKAYIDKSKLKNNIYNGDLILSFTGSPDFKNTDIKKLFKKLESLGIKQINGNILIDDSIFDHHKYPTGAEADDTNFCYMSPITALAINKNCINLLLAKENDKILIDKKAEIYIPIDIKSTARFTKNNASAINEGLELRYNENNSYDIFGNYYYKRELPLLRIAVHNTKEVLLRWLSYYADRYAIKISKNIQNINNINYKNYQNIYTHKSRPIKDMISNILLYSDNFISNVLLKTMGLKKYGKPLSFKKGIELMQQELSKIGVKDLVITDGAGFRTNINTVNGINKVLLAIYNEPKIFSIFKEHLPLSGKKGRVCLDNKFVDLPKGYKILAKTGTLQNIYALSGYILKNSKPVYAFTIAVNQFSNSKEKAFKIFSKEIINVININR